MSIEIGTRTAFLGDRPDDRDDPLDLARGINRLVPRPCRFAANVDDAGTLLLSLPRERSAGEISVQTVTAERIGLALRIAMTWVLAPHSSAWPAQRRAGSLFPAMMNDRHEFGARLRPLFEPPASPM